ncbi:MAG TPA: HEAT repeat domain-containing protein [Gemmata sp.]|jgi:hypothetical protein|nr:HEAT repeat domain-containing protein [Gemmata sp.]
MSSLRYLSVVSSFLIVAGACTAATPKEIDASVKLGVGYLKDQYKGATAKQVAGGPNGIGAAALAGLALLECNTPLDDPSVRAITAGVRDASFTTTQTYHIALCLLYLDRLGDPTDVPLIQMLGVRLLAGQNGNGGWTYECIESVPPLDERTLRTSLLTTELTTGNPPPAPGKANTPANPGKNPAITPGKAGVVGKLHPEVEKYQGRLASVRIRPRMDDNSNTQFGVLGVWVARKHGVPVEAALDLIETRFLNTQTINGGWPYAGSAQGSPSMTCAGLLGLATALGRREERRMTADIAKAPKTPKAPSPPKSDTSEAVKPAAKNEDPFFNPPPTPKPDDPFFNPAKPTPPAPPPAKNPIVAKPPPPKHPADVRDQAVQKALASLGAVLAGNGPVQGRGRGPRFLVNGGVLGDRDLYFLWSVERVGVIYGLEKIGNVDWYDLGAEELVGSQNISGSWGRGGRGAEVDTAFALLFLARSNLVIDLSHKVQRGSSTAELRAGAGIPFGGDNPAAAADTKPTVPPGAATGAKPAVPTETTEPRRPEVTVIRPISPSTDDPKTLAAELVGAMGLEWEKVLTKARDGKGTAYTQALVLALARLDGDRQKFAREALAERLTRMTAETLRSMAKAEEAELRRAAVLAMAMKDDKAYIPDLIGAILDNEEIVVRAAKAGLKSLSGQDFGPAVNASISDKKLAANAWLDWLRKQKE